MTHPTWTDRLARLVDTALDRSVVLGYPATGHAVRRRLSTWPKDPPRNALSGKHVLVTGASSGLGVRTAVDLAMLGAHVHLVVRDFDETLTEALEFTAAFTPAAFPVSGARTAS